MRHCAFCLEELSGSLIKNCSKCKKRAYCSKECQQKDWSVTGNGQRHKNWCCIYDYGEEDVDWEVVPVPNRGLGVRAKRFLPAGYRIIVEPDFKHPNDHPAINDLEPKGGSLEAKFNLNAFGCYVGSDGGGSLSLRISRVNHSCRANAAISYDDVACVNILFSLRDIQPNEEISVSYSHFCNFLDSTVRKGDLDEEAHPSIGENPEQLECAEFDIMEDRLESQYGITCPSNCDCKNPRLRELCMEGKKLYRKMLTLASKSRFEEALKAGERLLEMDRELNPSWIQRAGISFQMFEFAMVKAETRKRARRYLQMSYDCSQIFFPFSGRTRFAQKMLSHHPEDEWNGVYRKDMKKMIESLEQDLSTLTTY